MQINNCARCNKGEMSSSMRTRNGAFDLNWGKIKFYF